MKWLTFAAFILLTLNCSKKAPVRANPELLAQICELELQRHGPHPKVAISEYGSIHMDRYSQMPGPEGELWQAFLQADDVCRGAYFQLYFDLHRNRITRRWANNRAQLTSKDRTRLMRLIHARKAKPLRDIVLEGLKNDPSKEVRHEAGLALGIFDHKNDIETLRQIIRNEPEMDVLSAVALSLHIENDSPDNALLKEFGDITHLPLAQAIITIVATAELDNKPALLEPLAQSQNPEIALAAASALESLKTKEKLSFTVENIQPEKPETKPLNEALQRDLQQALLENQFSTAKSLLDQGARLDVSSFDGESMLHFLAVRGNPENIRWAVAHGADLESKAYNGQTPLMFASFGPASKWEPRLEALYHLGADLHATNGIGETALHIAARMGRVRLAQKLLDLGADSEVKDEVGRTPLNIAMLVGHDQIIDLLKQKKASGE